MTAPLRLSVTMLDTYMAGVNDDDMTAEELAQRLFGKFQSSLSMQAGTALHSALENASDADDLTHYLAESRNGFAFVLPDDLEGLVELGNVREYKRVWRVLPNVDLVGKIDAETQAFVIDHKLSGRFDPDRYMDSWQWRAYLAMTGKQRFAYQVFEHGGIPDDADDLGNRLIKIKDYHRLELATYDGLMADVVWAVEALADFARQWQPIIKGQTA